MDPHSSPQSSPRGSISAASSSASTQNVVDPYAELAHLRAQVHNMALAMQHQQQHQQQQQLAQQQPSAVHTEHLPKIRQPPLYSGAGGFAVDEWLGELRQQFAYYSDKFRDDASRVKYAVAHLAGPALRWWDHASASAAQAPSTWDAFVALLRERFRPLQAADYARQRLDKLRMGPQHSVSQYTNAFQVTLTPIDDMGQADQVHNYLKGLQPHLLAKVWEHRPKTLKDAIDLAVSAEATGNFSRAAAAAQRSSGGAFGRQFVPGAASSSSYSASVPMDLNAVESFLPPLEEAEMMPSSPAPLPPSSGAADPVSAMLAKMDAMQQTINALQQQQGGGGGFRRSSDLVAGLKPGEIATLMAEGRCFRCKQKGHMKSQCPQQQKKKSKNE